MIRLSLRRLGEALGVVKPEAPPPLDLDHHDEIVAELRQAAASARLARRAIRRTGNFSADRLRGLGCAEPPRR